MQELFNNIKSRFGKGKITLKNAEIIEITFENSEEPILIEKELSLHRYTISYPQLIIHQNGNKTNNYTTSNNLLEEGVFWIINQVQRNGKVLPELDF